MMVRVALERIRANAWQTRGGVDEVYIQELAADIASRLESRRATMGLLQVPAGRLVDDAGQGYDPIGIKSQWDFDEVTKGVATQGRTLYVELAYGHNRLAAFRLLSAEEPQFGCMPVDLVGFTDEEMATSAWAENARRRDLTAIEEAKAIQKMMESFEWSASQVAERLGLAASTVSNKLRLLRAPDRVQGLLYERRITERQAMAMLPVFELPQPAFQRANQEYYSPEKLVAAAEKGDNSDLLREQAEKTIRFATTLLMEDVPFLAHPFEMEGVQAGRCDECTMRVSFKREERCADRECFKAKEAAWSALRLAGAMAETGLTALEDDVNWSAKQYFGEEDRRWVREVLEEGCARGCLRLTYDGKGQQYGVRLDKEGFPDVRVVCHHDGKRCECLAGRKARATREENTADPEEVARREREKEVRRLVAPAYRAVGEALVAGHLGAWRFLMKRLNSVMGGKGENWSLERVAEVVAREMLYGDLAWLKDRPIEAQAAIVRRFKEMGLGLPWGEANQRISESANQREMGNELAGTESGAGEGAGR